MAQIAKQQVAFAVSGSLGKSGTKSRGGKHTERGGEMPGREAMPTLFSCAFILRRSFAVCTCMSRTEKTRKNKNKKK